MLQSVPSEAMTPNQIQLVEHALRMLSRISTPDWAEIPPHLQACFDKYMDRDVWVGGPDLLSLSEAALMILRDAITRSGDFEANAV